MDEQETADAETTWAELSALAEGIENRLIALSRRVDRLEEIVRARHGR
jgi:hypothetical protein